MDRIEISRDVFGPSESATGARFRDEVVVCSACRIVYRRVYAGCECLVGGKPGAPCRGRLFPPTAERGIYWLEGTEIRPTKRSKRTAILGKACAKCGAPAGQPCVAVGLLTAAGTIMGSYHAARKVAA